MRLRRLRLSDKKAYLDYIKAWENEPEIIPFSSRLQNLSFQAFLESQKSREKGTYMPDRLVPDVTYVLVDQDQTIYGALNLRLRLNDHLLAYDGHIGYGISPSKRGRGYGKLILKLGLVYAKKRGIDRVLVTCNEENTRSERVIISCGGIFENKVYKTDGYIKRFWIDLTPKKGENR